MSPCLSSNCNKFLLQDSRKGEKKERTRERGKKRTERLGCGGMGQERTAGMQKSACGTNFSDGELGK